MAIIDNRSIAKKIADGEDIRKMIQNDMKNLYQARTYGNLLVKDMTSVETDLKMINLFFKHSESYRAQVDRYKNNPSLKIGYKRTYDDYINQKNNKIFSEKFKLILEKLKNGYMYTVKMRELVLGERGKIHYQILYKGSRVASLETEDYINIMFKRISVPYNSTVGKVFDFENNIIELRGDISELDKYFEKNKKTYRSDGYKREKPANSNAVAALSETKYSGLLNYMYNMSNDKRSYRAYLSPLWRYLTSKRKDGLKLSRARAFEAMTYLSSKYNVMTPQDLNAIFEDRGAEFISDLDMILSDARTTDSSAYYKDPDSFEYSNGQLLGVENKLNGAAIRIPTILNGVKSINNILSKLTGQNEESVREELVNFFTGDTVKVGDALATTYINDIKKDIVDSIK